jgi:hypothetical protein
MEARLNLTAAASAISQPRLVDARIWHLRLNETLGKHLFECVIRVDLMLGAIPAGHASSSYNFY